MVWGGWDKSLSITTTASPLARSIPVTIAELRPLLFSRRIIWIEYPEFVELFAYSSTVWLVPSGELSSTTIISAFISLVSAERNESSIFTIFFDSLYVGITIERERVLASISFGIEFN